MDPMGVSFTIFVIIFGLIIISWVIESAVKRGINNSIISQYLKTKDIEIKDNKQ
jgi:hypothetical protein